MDSVIHKPIGELLKPVSRQAKIKRSDYQDCGQYPIVDQSQADIAGYTNDASWLYQGELPVVVFGDHTRVLKFVNFPFCVGADGTQLLRPIEGNDIRYFYYALRNVDLEAYGYERHFKYLKEEEIPIRALPVQQRIASILSAYDELIENCQRRIKILEQMARNLYREWFVNFRYPHHAKTPLVDSPLGKIPKGWEVKKLSEFVTTKYGYTESTNTQPVGPKYLRGMDINKTSFIDWSEVPYCPITPEDHEVYRLKVGDVVVIRMADPGKVGIVEQEVDAVFASYLIRVAPTNNRLNSYFLFYLMESAEYYAYVTGASTGTTRKSASAGVIADYQFVLPPEELVMKFSKKVGEMRSMLTALLKKNVNLRKTRDLLLPRLMSGQITLSL